MVDRKSVIVELSRIRDSVSALLDKLSDESKKGERVPPKQIAARLAAKRCMFCGKRPISARGLCSAHYQAVRRMIEDGKLTDAEAVERWKWLPEGARGRGRKSKYSPDVDVAKEAVAAKEEMDRSRPPPPPELPPTRPKKNSQ